MKKWQGWQSTAPARTRRRSRRPRPRSRRPPSIWRKLSIHMGPSCPNLMESFSPDERYFPTVNFGCLSDIICRGGRQAGWGVDAQVHFFGQFQQSDVVVCVGRVVIRVDYNGHRNLLPDGQNVRLDQISHLFVSSASLELERSCSPRTRDVGPPKPMQWAAVIAHLEDTRVPEHPPRSPL